LHNIRLIGHDLLPENKKFLTVGIVDFLICQRPEEQGYDAVNALFQGVVHKLPVREYNYAPIEIITRENLEFYHEFK
jgi:LacI family transcriptional regulator